MKHSIRVAAVAALAIGIAAPAYAADSFTFVSKTTPIDAVATSSPGGMVMGGVASVKSKATNADGSVQNAEGKCATWSAPPGGPFTTQGTCSLGDKDGEMFTAQFSCSADEPGKPDANCWALLIGTGGDFKGRTGVSAWRAHDGGSEGVGQWND